MKKIYLSCLLVLLSLFAVRAQDMVLGDFETDLGGWSTWGKPLSVEANPSMVGNTSEKVALLDQQTGGWSGMALWKDPPILANNFILVSVDVYFTNTAGSVKLHMDNSVSGAPNVEMFVDVLANQWKTVVFDISNLTAYDYKQIAFQTGVAEKIFFDNIKLINSIGAYGEVPVISATGQTNIQAEYFDKGGEGVAYSDLDTSNNNTARPFFRTDEGVDIEPTSEGGFDVGWTNAGEWLKYTINVEATKKYKITARVTSPTGQAGSNFTITFSKNGVTTQPLTSGTEGTDWQTWFWSVSDSVELEAGQQTMTINILGGNFNLDFVRFEPAGFVPVSVTGISLSESSLQLIKKDTVYLSATVTPENADNKLVRWTTSAPGVATVFNGRVIAVNKGDAVITATTDDGGFKAECAVSVSLIAVTGITISNDSLAMRVGEKDTIFATIMPANASTLTVTWTSSDKTIATVTGGGVVKGVKAGVVTITVTTKDGGFSKECIVTVLPPVGINNWNSSVKIYPNPARDRISIYSESDISSVSVMDLTGKIVIKQLFNQQKNISFNLNHIQKGIYIVNIEAGKEFLIKKLIID
jgi:uncharacterized protein YjdB